jgi:adenosylmethionine-8-amino-7-oxononanoate aminotransferase
VEAATVSTETLRANDIAHVLHPFTNLHAHAQTGPRILVRGVGALIYDVEGNEYVDSLAQLWNVNIGHGRRELGEAALAQMSTLGYSTIYGGFSNPVTIELATRLAALAPGSLNTVYFTSGGGDANETAFKLARLYWQKRGFPERNKIIARQRGFHGLTIGAMSATANPVFHEGFGPRAPGFSHIEAPYRYRCTHCQASPDCSLACADALDAQIRAEGPETVAAFIAEPVQGAGGVIPPPPGYMERIRAICDRHGVLFIADEVITGFGRTGRWFAVEHWNIVPDMLTFAKGVTSGYQPLGGTIISDAIREVLFNDPDFSLMHGFTYSGHPTACAVALKNIEILERERLIERGAEMGAYLQARIQSLADHRLVGDVRGFGMLGAIELVRDKVTREQFPVTERVAARVVAAAVKRGVLGRPLPGDTIAFAPPLVITREQIDRIVTAYRGALDEVAAGMGLA